MKSPFWITAAALLAIGAGAYALTNAQEPKAKPAEAGANKDQMPTPGPEHKALAGYVGKWNFKMKMIGEDGKPAESMGTCEKKWAMSGWFIEDMTKGNIMGGPFEGHGFTTFDTIKKKYVGVWMDSMGGAIMNSEGNFDAASKTFTYLMDMPTPEGKYSKTKVVEKWTSADSFTSTFTAEGSDGKGPHDFSLEYTRAK